VFRQTKPRRLHADTSLNANVFYELGIAHCQGNKTIMTSQELERLPFDLKSYRVIQYSQSASGLNDLRKNLDAAIKELLIALEYTNNPVQDYFSHTASLVKHINKIPAISYGCDEVSKYFHRTIIDSWNNEAEHVTKIQCLGVSLAYSWRPLRDLLEKILPDRPKNKKLSLSLSILDYKWHKFDSLNVDWIDSNKRLYVSLNEFLKNYGKQIEFNLFTYRYTPNWHGFLVDDTHLFISSCLLEKKRNGNYVLLVGQNEYEYFEDSNNEAFKIKVKQFRNWFSLDNKKISLEQIKQRARTYSS
jgi:hypothetical protein